MVKNRLILCFVVFLLGTFSSWAQLSFCAGQQGPPISNEDFGQGTAEGPPLGSNFTSYTYEEGELYNGTYTISNQIKQNAGWHTSPDHTGNSNGKALMINAETTPGIFYQKTITGLCENSSYEFSAWYMNVYNPASGVCGAALPINIRFEILDANGNFLKGGNTGDVGETTSPVWQKAGLTFNTGLGNNGDVILRMINNGSGGCGNDLAIDDIQFSACGDETSIVDADGGKSLQFCEGNSSTPITLNAQVETSVYESPIYQWQRSTNGVDYNDITGEDNSSFTAPALTETTFYRVKTAENAVNLNNSQCNTFSSAYRISPIAVVAPVAKNQVNVICDGNPVTLNVNVLSGEQVDWYDQATGGTPLQRGGTTYLATTPSTYYAEARNVAIGCISPNRTEIIVTSGNSPIVTDKNLIQCGAEIITLTPDVTVATYLWSTGETTETIEVTGPGEYSVLLTNSAGCTTIQSFNLSRTEMPIIDDLVQRGGSVEVLATSNVDLLYSIDGINYVLGNILVLPEIPQGTIYVRDINDCFVITQEFDFIVIPLYFTPNNDGFHDLWRLRGLENFNTVRLSIFDRYGKLIFVGSKNAMEWDGSYRGRPLPSSSYWYRLQADDRDIKGSVALKR